MTLGGVVSGPTFTCRHARTHACMFYICFVVPSPRSLVCAAHMNAGKRSGYFYCAFRCRCAGSQHRRLVSCDGDPAWTATWWPRHTRVCVCVCAAAVSPLLKHATCSVPAPSPAPTLDPRIPRLFTSFPPSDVCQCGCFHRFSLHRFRYGSWVTCSCF